MSLICDILRHISGEGRGHIQSSTPEGKKEPYNSCAISLTPERREKKKKRKEGGYTTLIRVLAEEGEGGRKARWPSSSWLICTSNGMDGRRKRKRGVTFVAAGEKTGRK